MIGPGGQKGRENPPSSKAEEQWMDRDLWRRRGLQTRTKENMARERREVDEVFICQENGEARAGKTDIRSPKEQTECHLTDYNTQICIKIY